MTRRTEFASRILALAGAVTIGGGLPASAQETDRVAIFGEVGVQVVDSLGPKPAYGGSALIRLGEISRMEIRVQTASEALRSYRRRQTLAGVGLVVEGPPSQRVRALIGGGGGLLVYRQSSQGARSSANLGTAYAHAALVVDVTERLLVRVSGICWLGIGTFRRSFAGGWDYSQTAMQGGAVLTAGVGYRF